MPRRVEVPLAVAVSAPLLALLASVATTSAVIEAGWLDAICHGALDGSGAPHGLAELVEAFWCDMRGAGREAVIGVRSLSLSGG